MNRLRLFEFIGFAALLSSAADVLGASLSERLAELGHPNTNICRVAWTSKGLGSLIVVQYRPFENRSKDKAEAQALLGIMEQALVKSGQGYVGFEARKGWETCRDRDPEYIFWRDYDDNWRFMDKAPVKYLSMLEDDLAAELRGTADEAFVLFSLGLVEQRLERVPASVERFERAYDLLLAGEDPDGIKAKLLMPLIHHHFGEDGEESRGQTYLNDYALIAGNTPGKDNYLPLIKVAPLYPTSALRAGIQGWVLLEFTVTRTGQVVDPFVVEAQPPGTFDEAAIQAARSFRYIPQVVDGKPVDVSAVRNRITFELRR